MAYAHGSVVLAPASHKHGARPYLVVSNESRPFFGTEYTVAVITTRKRALAIELGPARLTQGRLNRYPSYVNPWSLHVFQHDAVDRRVAQVDESILAETADVIYDPVRPAGS